jgi:hypothetical protein
MHRPLLSAYFWDWSMSFPSGHGSILLHATTSKARKDYEWSAEMAIVQTQNERSEVGEERERVVEGGAEGGGGTDFEDQRPTVEWWRG